MNKTEAKILILLKQLPVRERTVYVLAGKLERSTGNIYNSLRVLEAMNHIEKHRIKGHARTVFLVRSEEAVLRAHKILEEANKKKKQEQEPTRENIVSDTISKVSEL